MEDTKKVLRSILVSTPLKITAKQLCKDYKDIMGYPLPFKELGYDSVLAFLHDIPDVLILQSNSLESMVTLIVSSKTAHVNDMVLRQKTPNGKGFRGKRSRLNSRLAEIRHSPTKTQIYDQSWNRQSYDEVNSFNCRNMTNYAQSSSRDICENVNISPKCKNASKVEKYIPSPLKTPSQDNSIPRFNVGVNDSPRIRNVIPRFNASVNDSIPRFNVNNSERSVNIMEVEEPAPKPLLQSHSISRTHIGSLTRSRLFSSTSPTHKIPSLFDIKIDKETEIAVKEQLLQKHQDDFMRQLLLKKDDLDMYPRKAKAEVNKSVNVDCRVPEVIRNELQDLISNYDEGVWCTQLPAEYKKRFDKELKYERFGYRCLIHMCLDLDSIFYCNQESACDYKLYDARKPVPELQIQKDFHEETPPELEKSLVESPPRLDWSSCALVIPPNVLRMGAQIPKEFVDDKTKVGDVIQVVVVEIYDISKFWINKNNGRLDELMDDMQEFYKENKDRYVVPKSLLSVGLYCVVVIHNEYHRAFIVNNWSQNDFVKVFFIDYGSLGKAPKTQVYFLLKKFSELPAQAIRARLSDIYPLVENAMWSRKAVLRFRELASMKKVEAKITRIVPNKNILELYLLDTNAQGQTPMNNILVNENHAILTTKKRKLLLEDVNCLPKVKFVHLFPSFEEIEYWLVPSVEDVTYFWETDVSPELFFPQYFKRAIDVEEMDAIDKRMQKTLKKREKLVKYFDFDKMKLPHSLSEMNKLAYGATYSENIDAFIAKESECDALFEVPDKKVESDEDLKSSVNRLRSHLLNGSGYEDRNDGSGNFYQKLTVPALKSLEKFYQMDTELEKKKKSGWGSGKPLVGESGILQKYFKGINGFTNMADLEKYLSEDDPSRSSSSRSPNTSDLLDLDESCPSSFTGLRSWSDSTSLLTKKRNSFFSDAKSVLEPQVASCNDLIDLHDDAPCIPAPSKLKASLPPDLLTGDLLENYNSDGTLNPHAPEFVMEHTGKNVAEKEKCSKQNDVDSSTPTLKVAENNSDFDDFLPKKPPPGFAPLNSKLPKDYTVYQPWSTGDLNKPRQMGMGFPPQMLMSQFSSFYQCPPIMVFNYNPHFQPNLGVFGNQMQPSNVYPSFNLPKNPHK